MTKYNHSTYGQLRPFLFESIDLILDIIASKVALVDHLSPLVAYSVDTWLVAVDLREKSLVLLH